jgi:hypothetical protein
MSKTAQVTANVSPETKNQLKLLARQNNITLSELTQRLYDQLLQANSTR